MDNMTDLRILDSMTDFQILDLIRNDLIKVQNGMKKIQNDVENVQNDMKKVQESLAKALACTKNLDSLVEDGLRDVEACVGDSACDDPQQQIFIAAKDDDPANEAEDTSNLGDELSFSIDNQVVVPYLDETMDDMDAAANGHVRETPKSGLYSTLKIETHHMSEEFQEVRSYSCFWIFDPGICFIDSGACQYRDYWATIVSTRYDLMGAVYGQRVTSNICMGQGGDSLPLFLGSRIKCAKILIVETDSLIISTSIEAMGSPVFSRMDSSSSLQRFISKMSSTNQLLLGGVPKRLYDLYLFESDIEKFIFELSPSLSLLATGSSRLEEFDPFWIATLDSTFEARQRLMLMNLICTCSNELFLHSMTQRHLKIVLKGGHVFLGKAMVRDYDGFNGPGFFRGAFDSILALV